MLQIKTGIILAAGRGKRLGELALEQPKPMVRVNNVSIIGNLVKSLINNGIENIVVVVGYLADRLKKHLEPFQNYVSINFIENEFYDKTNNIYSLWLSKDFMKNGFYLFEADIFCEDQVIENLSTHQAENIAVIDKFNKSMSGTVVALNSSNELLKMYLKRAQADNFTYSDKYKTVNFYKISQHFVKSYFKKRLKEHIKNKDLNSYYEQVIKEGIDSGYKFYGLKTGDLKWYEIDTPANLHLTERLFS